MHVNHSRHASQGKKTILSVTKYSSLGIGKIQTLAEVEMLSKKKPSESCIISTLMIVRLVCKIKTTMEENSIY